MILKGKHIYIVEDNPQNRVVFTMALKVHGASIEYDRWGDQSLHHLNEFHSLYGVDLIILDLMLTDGITGFDIHHTIRSQHTYDAVPIIAVSAMDASIAIPRVRQSGFSGFIAKPVDEKLFPQQVAKLIKGEAIWDVGGLRY